MIVNLLLKTNGEVHENPPANGETYTLEELQGAVDGYIELVYPQVPEGVWIDPRGVLVDVAFAPEAVVVVNEEGRLQKLPLNMFASAICNRMIVGNALLCELRQLE